MELNLNSILLGSENPAKLVQFYTQVLGDPSWKGEQGNWSGWQVGSGWLGIGPHDKVHGNNQTPGRIMPGFETKDVQTEFERIKGLGADVVAVPYHPGESSDMWLCTFADPDGNYFQLASPFKKS